MITIKKSAPLRGELTIPGDKSISHRAVMFGSIARGITVIHGFLHGADCLSTIDCFRKMHIRIEEKKDEIHVHGNGLHGLHAPEGILPVGNSGTTTRLMSGILAGQPFSSEMSGDASLNSRPMRRIMDPLQAMGADITSIHGNDCAPLLIRPAKLHGIEYHSRVASAQVKSCILLAGLYADGPTRVTEPAVSRDHTERMLGSFGADLQVSGKTVSIEPCSELFANEITVPGDISSATYFIAAGLLVPGSEILIRHVGINPTRAGILEVCRAMGADLTLCNEHISGGEPVADILVKHSTLHGCVIEGDIIPRLIDEIPMIAVMAALAEGRTVIRDAAELKVKESDRIAIVTKNLLAMGADITATEDGFIIEGKETLQGASIECEADHRIAMSFAIAGLCAHGDTMIKDGQCVSVSFPSFFHDLDSLRH